MKYDKALLIERARIMYEVIYELDSTVLAIDMTAMSIQQANTVHNKIQQTYENAFGESAQEY